VSAVSTAEKIESLQMDVESAQLRATEGTQMGDAEKIAQAFHEQYERLAPAFGYKTREASAVPWADVPDDNKHLMIEVVDTLLGEGVIVSGAEHDLAQQFVDGIRTWYEEAEKSGLIAAVMGPKS
jgi:hypothetical protein